MRATLAARPRLHRVLAPVAFVAIAAATAPAALLMVAACRQAPRSTPAATRPELQPRPALLRVCTDPHNLPFSKARGESFGGPPAELARFVRETVGERCDVVMGVPADLRFPVLRNASAAAPGGDL